MKSKAHSKKCQETGVLEELEAEEGNELPTSLILSSPTPLLLYHLLFYLSFSPSPSFLSSSPLLPLPAPPSPFHALSSSPPSYWETRLNSQHDHPPPHTLRVCSVQP